MKWSELDYWASGEWQAASEKLDDLTKKGVLWCPGKKNLFSVFRVCPMDTVRVCIIGQDPYPNVSHATGIAFDIPAETKQEAYPPTLKNIFKEYEDDLHYPSPTTGSLRKWCERGVFLWNAIPTCEAGKPASHHWPEWELLTQELVEKLDQKDVVFVLMGSYAREFSKNITRHSKIITSHPAPLGAKWGFFGSRLFTKVNCALGEQGLEAIDWRL